MNRDVKEMTLFALLLLVGQVAASDSSAENEMSQAGIQPFELEEGEAPKPETSLEKAVQTLAPFAQKAADLGTQAAQQLGVAACRVADVVFDAQGRVTTDIDAETAGSYSRSDDEENDRVTLPASMQKAIENAQNKHDWASLTKASSTHTTRDADDDFCEVVPKNALVAQKQGTSEQVTSRPSSSASNSSTDSGSEYYDLPESRN